MNRKNLVFVICVLAIWVYPCVHQSAITLKPDDGAMFIQPYPNGWEPAQSNRTLNGADG